MKGTEDDFSPQSASVHSVTAHMRPSGLPGAQELRWVQKDPTRNDGDIPVA